MKRVNLLPEHLIRAQRLSKGRRRWRLILILLVMVGAAGVTAAQLWVHRLNRAIAATARDVEPMRERLREYEALQKEHDRLVAQADLIRTLREPLPPVAILALLTQLTPDDITAHKLVIELPSGQPQRVLIQLDGVARVNTAVPTLMRSLVNSGVFADVQIGNSRRISADPSSGQQFHLAMNIPMVAVSETTIASGGRP